MSFSTNPVRDAAPVAVDAVPETSATVVETNNSVDPAVAKAKVSSAVPEGVKAVKAASNSAVLKAVATCNAVRRDRVAAAAVSVPLIAKVKLPRSIG